MSEINERVVPHSKEAERSVLGAAMLDEDAYYDISEYIKPGDFYYKNHREIWEAISELVQERTPADYLTVCEQLKKRGSLDLVGGAVYVAELTADVPSTSNAGAYGKIIAEKANLRNLIEAADDILAKSFSPDVESQQMIDYAEQSIFSVAQGRSIKDTSDLRDIVLENIQLMDERARNKGSLTGVPTGLTDLDKRLSGPAYLPEYLPQSFV